MFWIFRILKCKFELLYPPVPPDPPMNIQIDQVSNNVTLMWSPGFTGYSDLATCTIQVVYLIIQDLSQDNWEINSKKLFPLCCCIWPIYNVNCKLHEWSSTIVASSLSQQVSEVWKIHKPLLCTYWFQMLICVKCGTVLLRNRCECCRANLCNSFLKSLSRIDSLSTCPQSVCRCRRAPGER